MAWVIHSNVYIDEQTLFAILCGAYRGNKVDGKVQFFLVELGL